MSPSHDDALLTPVSRRRAALWSAAFAYGSLVLLLARNIALVPLFITHIGELRYGEWLASGGVLAQFTSLDFGLFGVLLQRVAAAYGRRDRAALERLIGTGLIVTCAIAVAMGVLAGALAPLIPRWLGAAGAAAATLRWSFVTVGAAGALQLLAFALSGLLQGLQRTFWVGALRMAAELTALAGTAWLVVHGWGVAGIAIGLLLRALVELGGSIVAFLWIGVRRLGLRPRFSRTVLPELGQLSLWQFLTQIAGRIKMGVDPFLIGVLVGPVAVSAYAVTTRAHETVRLFGGSLGAAVTPSLAHLHGEGRRPRFRQIVALAARFQALTGAIGLGGVIALNAAFVSLWVRPELYAGHTVTIFAGLWGFAYLLSTVPYDALYAMGEFNRIAKLVWLETAVRTALITVGAVGFGLAGVAVAAFLSQALLGTLLLAWVLARRLGLPAGRWRLLVRDLVWLAAPPGLLAAVLLASGWQPASWPRLIATAAGFVGVTLIGAAWADRSLLPQLVAIVRGRDSLDEPA